VAHNRNLIRYVAGTLYAVAILVALFVGGLIPVIIVGAILLAMVYTGLNIAGRSSQGPGRERNRNRDRNRDGSSGDGDPEQH